MGSRVARRLGENAPLAADIDRAGLSNTDGFFLSAVGGCIPDCVQERRTDLLRACGGATPAKAGALSKVKIKTDKQILELVEP